MKIRNKMIMKTVTFCLLAVSMLVIATPAYAWSYSIQWGDSLYLLSERYGARVTDLKDANRLSSERIYAGRRLWIPDSNPVQNSQVQISEGDNDLYLLAHLINGEARGEPFEGQVAVGAVILNRIRSGKFPGDIAGNIYQGLQFESVANGEIWRPLSESSINAAKAALQGWDPTGGALYFYNPAKVYSKYNWIWSRPIIHRIGNHVFAL